MITRRRKSICNSDFSDLINEDNYNFIINENDDKFVFTNYYILKYCKNILQKSNRLNDLNKNIPFLTSNLDKETSFEIYNNLMQSFNSIKENEDEDFIREEENTISKILESEFIKNYINTVDKLFKTKTLSENNIQLKMIDIKNTFKLNDYEYEILIYEYLYSNVREFGIFLDSYSLTERHRRNNITSCSSISKITGLQIVEKILENPNKMQGFRILLYGKAGTGKTEFARTITVKADYICYQLNENLDEGDKNNKDFRLRSLFAYENCINIDKSIIIVDEADELLSTRNSIFGVYSNNQKGRINLYFDESITNQIWIVNDIRGIDESTMRRFDYCIYFPEFSVDQKIKVFKNILNEFNLNDIIAEDDIRLIADKYTINAGNIKNAVRNYTRIHTGEPDKEQFHSIVTSSLKSYMLLKKSTINLSDKASITDKYCLDGLNICSNGINYLPIIENFNSAWKSGTNRAKNMNILMYGPPGTGKTEFAKFLAKHLDRKITIKSPSDILSKWVGGTEENIANAFRAAQNESGMLFIDETDAILRSRDKAEHSWESTQVNELLVQMENFTGIFISSTNRFEDLDQAVLRRFNIKIMFDYLLPEGIKHFMNTYFTEFIGNNITVDCINEASNIKNLAPGDFKVVSQKLMYMEPETITGDIIINFLNEEAKVKQQFKSRKIGFA